MANQYILQSLPPSLRAHCPEATDQLDAVMELAWNSCDPVLLELVRLRIATLVGNDEAALAVRHVDSVELSEAKIAQLPSWPTSPLFDERERDCLSFAEQFAMDVTGFTDADVAAARRHFTPGGFYAFVTALYLMDFGQRLELASTALLGRAS